MRKILVTGATGQDGSYLVERLVADRDEVHAIVRIDGPEASETALPPEVVRHTADLGRPESLASVVSSVVPDAIVNLGGLSSVALSWRRPVVTAQVNALAVCALLDAAWDLQARTGAEIRFLQASSSEIFGAATSSPQTEDTPLRPRSPYGASKAHAHAITESYRQRGMHASSAILYNHESPRRPPTFVTRKITSTVARIARGLADRLLLGDRAVRRDWGWAPDYVDAMLLMLRAPEPETYVVATGQSRTIDDFVRAAFTRVGIANWEGLVESDHTLRRPVETTEMCGDSSRLRETLGWRPTVDFQGIVERMVDADLALVDRRG